MGRTLDALLGRNFKTSKLKSTLNHAISRVVILTNHRRARFTIAQSDLIQLLRLNPHEQALIRVEQVIKDKNMLDVYDMVDGYCRLLIQRINLIDKTNDCPEELKEAVSSILYAAPRCGEFPELQEIRGILTTRYGKDFADGSIDSRSNYGVSQKMIQKLSQKQSSLECRMKTLREIAKENGIVLQLEKTSPEIIKEKLVDEKRPSQLNTKVTVLPKKIEKVLSLSESMKKGYDKGSSTPRYDSESKYENERSKNNMKAEEIDDLYSVDYSDDDDDDDDEEEETGFQARNAHFSSYKQFPARDQANPKSGLGPENPLDIENNVNSTRTKRSYGR